MTTLRQFCMNDLLKFNNVNLDVLTETYNMPFYMSYMSQWPEAFVGECDAERMSIIIVDWCIRWKYFVIISDSSYLRVLDLSVAEAPNGDLMGYNLGKAEGDGELWHGHVSAVTVAPTYRRLGLAKTLMDDFENVCIHTYDAYFVDLFVRASNHLAQNMYRKFGYSTYRRVLGYYMGEDPEDALDMRKALPRDRDKKSVIPLDHPVYPEDLEW